MTLTSPWTESYSSFFFILTDIIHTAVIHTLMTGKLSRLGRPPTSNDTNLENKLLESDRIRRSRNLIHFEVCSSLSSISGTKNWLPSMRVEEVSENGSI